MSNFLTRVSLVLLLSLAAVPSSLQANLPWGVVESAVATATSGIVGTSLGLLTKVMLEIRNNSEGFNPYEALAEVAKNIRDENKEYCFLKHLLESSRNFTQVGAAMATGMLAGTREFKSGGGKMETGAATVGAGGGMLLGVKLGAKMLGVPGAMVGGILVGTAGTAGASWSMEKAMLRWNKNKKEDK